MYDFLVPHMEGTDLVLTGDLLRLVFWKLDGVRLKGDPEFSLSGSLSLTPNGDTGVWEPVSPSTFEGKPTYLNIRAKSLYATWLKSQLAESLTNPESMEVTGLEVLSQEARLRVYKWLCGLESKRTTLEVDKRTGIAKRQFLPLSLRFVDKGAVVLTNFREPQERPDDKLGAVCGDAFLPLGCFWECAR